MGKLKNKDIAIALNISTAAVSMALNNKSGVSDETRQKVLSYYAQHSNASSLSVASQLSKTLIFDIYKETGDIIIEKPFFAEIMSSLNEEARKHGYLLVVSHCDSNTDMKKHIEDLNAQKADGLLLLATELTASALTYYKDLDFPFVLLDGYIDEVPCDSVTLDNSNAIFRAYKYAFDMGHRNIGYLKCSTNIPNFTHRFDGFCKARRTFEPELSNQPPIVFSLPGNLKTSSLCMQKILEDLPNNFKMPTCFLADLDFVAIGAMISFTKYGYSIPSDISLIGYDNIDLSSICSPPLTTLHLHQRTLARSAVSLLVKRITNPDLCNIRVTLTSDIIIRDSVANLINTME